MAEKTMNELIREARNTLGLFLDGDLAKFLGVSRRTIQRHAKHAGIPAGDGHARIARALYPKNPALALTIAKAVDIDLSDLVTAAAAPPPRPEPGALHVASVVLAACEALDRMPREVRPALAAIFRHARTLGVDMDKLAKLLAEPGKP